MMTIRSKAQLEKVILDADTVICDAWNRNEDAYAVGAMLKRVIQSVDLPDPSIFESIKAGAETEEEREMIEKIHVLLETIDGLRDRKAENLLLAIRRRAEDVYTEQSAVMAEAEAEMEALNL